MSGGSESFQQEVPLLSQQPPHFRYSSLRSRLWHPLPLLSCKSNTSALHQGRCCFKGMRENWRLFSWHPEGQKKRVKILSCKTLPTRGIKIDEKVGFAHQRIKSVGNKCYLQCHFPVLWELDLRCPFQKKKILYSSWLLSQFLLKKQTQSYPKANTHTPLNLRWF